MNATIFLTDEGNHNTHISTNFQILTSYLNHWNAFVLNNMPENHARKSVSSNPKISEAQYQIMIDDKLAIVVPKNASLSTQE